MPRIRFALLLGTLVFILPQRIALAGMPSVTFSDVARLRLQTISFFLMGLLLSAAVIMAIWNSLRRDFAWLPRLSFPKACGLVTLWGLLFVIVLTMISGARELMTPGAWEKQGLTYKLRDRYEAQTMAGVAAAETTDLKTERAARISQLFGRLAMYAATHGGNFPGTRHSSELPNSAWEIPGLPGTHYALVADRRVDDDPVPLIYEPEVFDGKHFVVLTSGKIEQLSFVEISRLLERLP